MKISDVSSELSANAYPGRGIIIGRSADNKNAVAIYFIMGRSLNSRNRVFTKTEDGIKTEAYDPSKMSDPSLIIYHPVRLFNGHLIVTNGDQTDTIRDGMEESLSFCQSLMTREFEPDNPNYTPRISGIIMPDGSYELSILKSLGGDPSCCCRYFFDYNSPLAGVGHMIHTYLGDGEPIPSFEGEPKTVGIYGDISDYANAVWEALNFDNKVSLYACSIEIRTGIRRSIIINKYC